MKPVPRPTLDRSSVSKPSISRLARRVECHRRIARNADGSDWPFVPVRLLPDSGDHLPPLRSRPALLLQLRQAGAPHQRARSWPTLSADTPGALCPRCTRTPPPGPLQERDASGFTRPLIPCCTSTRPNGCRAVSTAGPGVQRADAVLLPLLLVVAAAVCAYRSATPSRSLFFISR